VVYERILKQASERSLAELAVALESTPDDVRALFESQGGEDFSLN
jgi:CarD family transcriptional regulator